MAVRDEQGNITAQFDMDVLFLTRLDQAFIESRFAAAQGDLITWYRILREIYRMLYFKIRIKRADSVEETEKELEKAFKDARDYFKEIDRTKSRSLSANYVSDIEEILDQISLKLSTLLNDYEIVFPQKGKFDPTGSVERGISGY